MTTLQDLPLTPGQHAELGNQNPALIDAWLTALNATPGIKSPIGWLLAGIRTGQPPADLNDLHQRTDTQKAERLIGNIGANIPTETELIATIFGPPETTADTATLEHIAATLTPDQEQILGPTLRAQLAFTRTNGRQPIPDTGGPLRHHDTPELRRQMLNHWRQQRARYVDTEADAIPIAAIADTEPPADD